MLDAWFGYSQRCFEIFLEMKFELYASVTAPFLANTSSSGEGVDAFLVGPNLKAQPTVYIDEVHEMLCAAYEGLDDGYDLKESNTLPTTTTTTTGGTTEPDSEDSMMMLYGELTPTGVRQLGAYCWPFLLSNDGSDIGSAGERSFVDLGSGTGKLIFEMAHLTALRHASNNHTTSNSSSASVSIIGVELSLLRHRIALTAAANGCAVPFEEEVVDGSTSTSPVAAAAAGSGGVSLVYAHSDFLQFPLPHQQSIVCAFACVLGFHTKLTEEFLAMLCSLRQTCRRLRCVVMLLRGVSPNDLPDWKRDATQRSRTTAAKEDGKGSQERGHIALHPFFWQDDITEIRWIKLETTWMDEAPAVMVCF